MDNQHTPSPAAVSAVQPDPQNMHVRVTQRAQCDWPEGDYECACATCGVRYIGPKRSVCCRLCAPPAPTPAVPVEAKQEPRITFAHEVDGPWRLELNGVTVSRHDSRNSMNAALTALRSALLASPTAGTPAPAVPTDLSELLDRYARLQRRAGELWERCQGKGWGDGPGSYSEEFTSLRDETLPALRAQIIALSAAPAAPAPLDCQQERDCTMHPWCKDKCLKAVPSAGTAAAVPYWKPCNEGCDPEFGGYRTTGCGRICEAARTALAQTQTKGGTE